MTRRKVSALTGIAFGVLVAWNGAVNALEPTASPEAWYAAGAAELSVAIRNAPIAGRAKNIILFIGDGMGVSTVTAARIYAGQQAGLAGEEHVLSFETLPNLGLAKVYNTNQQTPDSAGTMTAIMSGAKTKAGLIGLNANTIRGDCESGKGNELPSLLEQVEARGWRTGIVTTTTVTHATPAATYAKAAERNWESSGAMPRTEIAAGCKDIADQLIHLSAGDGIDVILGGGRRHFLPAASGAVTDDHGIDPGGSRNDGRDLIAEWRARNPDGRYVASGRELAALKSDLPAKVLGLFNPSHLHFDLERADKRIDEPSLVQMTGAAIDILSGGDHGFFLMVEGGRIDHAHHATSARYALADTVAFADAVQLAMEKTDPQETLIIVTADHGHVMTLAGYPTRGNPILGPVIGNDRRGNAKQTPVLAKDQRPYTTVGYINGRPAAGHNRDGHSPGSRFLTEGLDTAAADFRAEVLVPLGAETHSGEDVAIYAGGPWAHLIRRTHEQHFIYHVMRHAAGLNEPTQ